MFPTLFLGIFVSAPLVLLVGSVGRTTVAISRKHPRPLAAGMDTSVPVPVAAPVQGLAVLTPAAPALTGPVVRRPIGAGTVPDAAAVLAFRPRQAAPVTEQLRIWG
ncbi:MAG: hypothetical protein JWN65_3924 [Solirubrobacterales bacterium]|nr:hypothetical protein [Solirubrobacterales bacterium]